MCQKILNLHKIVLWMPARVVCGFAIDTQDDRIISLWLFWSFLFEVNRLIFTHTGYKKERNKKCRETQKAVISIWWATSDVVLTEMLYGRMAGVYTTLYNDFGIGVCEQRVLCCPRFHKTKFTCNYFLRSLFKGMDTFGIYSNKYNAHLVTSSGELLLYKNSEKRLHLKQSFFESSLFSFFQIIMKGFRLKHFC